VQAHFLGASEDALDESELHHRLAARYRQSSIDASQRRSKFAETAQYLLGRYVGPVLEMPGIRIMAIGASEQAARNEQHDPQAGTVVPG
jgi:hypothetical protein